MSQNKQSLMKIFSLVLKERSKAESEFRVISPEMLKFFSRKELIEIITKIFNGSVPKEHNLVEMENEGLLKLIGDDLFIISYMSEKWSKEVLLLSLAPEHPIIPASVVAASAKIEAKKNETKKEDPKGEEKKD